MALSPNGRNAAGRITYTQFSAFSARACKTARDRILCFFIVEGYIDFSTENDEKNVRTSPPPPLRPCDHPYDACGVRVTRNGPSNGFPSASAAFKSANRATATPRFLPSVRARRINCGDTRARDASNDLFRRGPLESQSRPRRCEYTGEQPDGNDQIDSRNALK